MLTRAAATVVQVLHGLFYVLLHLLVVAAIILSLKFYRKFYCKLYCSCDPSFSVFVRQFASGHRLQWQVRRGRVWGGRAAL